MNFLGSFLCAMLRWALPASIVVNDMEKCRSER